MLRGLTASTRTASGLVALRKGAPLHIAAYIDGSWVESSSGDTFDVSDPGNGEVIATVADCGAVETRDAVIAAQNALPSWSATLAKDRASVLEDFAAEMRARADDLAVDLTRECGKPLVEARGELAYGTSYLDFCAEEAKRAYGDIIPATVPDRTLLVQRQPVGVCGLITPWNFPNAMIARKVAAALAAGNTTVIKPAEDTPISALRMAEAAEAAGVPPGVINVVPASRSNAAIVGAVLTSSPEVKKISFTGSTAVGKELLRQSASTVKRTSMELGGNAPFIVFDDADVDAAVDGCIAAKFRNAGQTCVCANRIIVQEGVYDEFLSKFAERVAALTVGYGLDEGVDVGPLINKVSLEKSQRLVREAIAAGATAVVGGNPHALGGTYFEPTVLRDVKPTMSVCEEEIFGPIAPVLRFRDESDAVMIANASSSGLAGYFYSRDMSRVSCESRAQSRRVWWASTAVLYRRKSPRLVELERAEAAARAASTPSTTTQT